MKILKNILVAIDFSESSENVIKNSVKFAKAFKSKITLIHILPDDIDNEKVKLLIKKTTTEKLEELNNRFSNDGIETGEPILEYGNYCDKIVNASDKLNANLVIVGSGEKVKNDAFQLGSTAEKIIRKSDKPVFVVKSNQTLNIQNIICPIDFSKESGRALKSALVMSRIFNAQLIILSVYQLYRQSFAKLDADSINKQRALEHKKELNTFLEDFNLIDVNCIYEIKGGEPANEILKAIKNHKSDLFIMGTTGKSGISKILMGSVTEKVIRQVLCSFITLKNEDAIVLELESKIQDIEKHYATAQELYEKGFFKESINQYIICLDLNFAHLPSLKGLAEVYKRLGDIPNEKKYLDMVKKILNQIQNMKIEQEVRAQIKK